MSSPVLVETRSGEVTTPIKELTTTTLSAIASTFKSALRLLAPSTFGAIQFSVAGVLVDGSVRMNTTSVVCSSIGLGDTKKAITAPQYNSDVLTAGNYRGQQRVTSQGYAGSGTALDSNWAALPFDSTTDRIIIPASGFYEVCYHAVVGFTSVGSTTLDKPAMFLFVNEQCVSFDLSHLSAQRFTSPTSAANRNQCILIDLGRTVNLELRQGDEIRTGIMCNNTGGRDATLDEYHVYVYRTWMEKTAPQFG